VHATFWLGIEQRSNRRPHQMNRVRYMHHTRTKNRSRKIESIYGAGFWSVCHVYKTSYDWVNITLVLLTLGDHLPAARCLVEIDIPEE